MTIFQYLEWIATFAVSTEMPVVELSEVYAASGDKAALVEKGERLAGRVAEDLAAGSGRSFVWSWMILNQLSAEKDEYRESVQPLVDLAVEMEESEVLGSRGETERWLSLLEMMLARTDSKRLESLAGIDSLPSKYGIIAIASGNGERASRWYYSLSEETEPFFYAGLKMRNQLLRRLRKAVNPEEVDPAELEDQQRIDLVKAYLKHPFEHRLQPFYSKTFSQLIEWKILTPDELFEHGEDLVDAHFRQGMAYLDLAREYRKAGRFEKALSYIDKGMTTRLQFENRLGCYLIEKVIIHRDAGEIEKAWEVMGEVPNEHLDQYNRELRAKVIASLSELDR